MKARPHTTRPAAPARRRPTYIATSVDVGPGIALLGTLALLGGGVVMASSPPGAAAPARNHYHLDCRGGRPTCTEVGDSESVFGKGVYIGHDEPATLFYSDHPGAGNRMSYDLTL